MANKLKQHEEIPSGKFRDVLGTFKRKKHLKRVDGTKIIDNLIEDVQRIKADIRKIECRLLNDNCKSNNSGLGCALVVAMLCVLALVSFITQ